MTLEEREKELEEELERLDDLVVRSAKRLKELDSEIVRVGGIRDQMLMTLAKLQLNSRVSDNQYLGADYVQRLSE
jgi:hypothetical protein